MHYYIDGYNLMFRILRAGEDLQIQRQKIIEDLNTKIHFLELDVTLVFDSQYHQGESSRSYKQHLEILFTSLGQTADDLILDEIKRASKPEQTTVITSDKKLSWSARRRGAKSETVEEFILWLNKRCQNKLRHLKEKRKQTQDKEKPIPKVLPKKKIVQRLTSPEESFDFYQETFEKKYQEMVRQKKVPEPIKKKKPRSIPKSKGPSLESDTDRWLKAFENGKKDEDPF